MEEVQAGVYSFGVGAVGDGHGEGVATGVLAAGDRGVDVAGQLGLGGDALFEPGDRAAEGVLVTQVGAFGADEAGQSGVGFCLVHQERVVGGEGLGFAERQDCVADVADLAGVQGRGHDVADEPGLAFQYRRRNSRRNCAPSGSG